MDDQLWAVLELTFEILQNTAFFVFVYGMKALSWITKIVDGTMNDDGWLMKLALTCLIILASLQTIRMVYRSVMFWLRFAFKLAFLLGSIAVMIWLWSRGVDGAWEDLSIVTQFWLEQYRRYEDQAKTSKALYDVVRDARDAFANERQRVERTHGGRRW